MEINNEGFEKRVIILKKYVIKFPKINIRLPLAMVSIFEEFLLLYLIRDKRLAPIVFCIPFICTIMKKAEMISEQEWKEDIEHFKELFKSKLFYADINIHHKNIGRIKDNLVLVDYNFLYTINLKRKIKQIFKNFIKTQVTA